jgi:gluconolactonase
LFSDIPNNRLMRWDEATGTVSVFREPANYSNGNTRDPQGRLVTCEHGQRRVTRTEYDGSITVLAERFAGKRLNSPNDVVSAADGSIWFSDPPFGLSLYEGNPGSRELQTEGVYRVDSKTGAVSAVIENMSGPNGLCFSPDESKLYVVESRAKPNRLIWAYDVQGGTRLANPRVLIDCGRGTSDGLRCDQDGNLWCGWGMGSDELDGVMIFSPQGKAIGRIRLPERCANLCFGGAKNNRLFMAASQSLYSIYVNTRGATKW